MKRLVRVEGLEPPRLAAPEPKSGASANFATPASQVPISEPRLAREPEKGMDLRDFNDVAATFRHDTSVFAQHPVRVLPCAGRFLWDAVGPAHNVVRRKQGAKSTRDRAGFDMNDLTPSAMALRMHDLRRSSPVAIAAATLVVTRDGALPVEHLYPGDHLMTRHGARTLTAVDRVDLPAGTPIVTITQNALGGRPERDMWLPAAQRILIRGWRAQALYGQQQVCIPVGQLADGEFIRLEVLPKAILGFALRFGRPEVFCADGLELASADRLGIFV
jgi:hypothetical protein